MHQFREIFEQSMGRKKTVLLFTGDKGSTLLMDVIKDMDVNIVFIDTGYHFDETMVFVENFGSKIEIIGKSEPLANYTDDMDSCCNQRKTELLKKYLSELKARCLIVPFIDEERDNGIEDSYLRGIDNIKIIRPLADLTERDIWLKIKKYKLPYSTIYNNGYRIVDCKCCTTRHGRKKHVESGTKDMDEETKERLESLGYM